MVARDELQYFGILLSSVFLGSVVARLPPGNARLWFSTGIGFVLITCFCGWNALHPYITILVNGLIITYIRDCHKWSFLFSFAYLGFFRAVKVFGLPETSEFVNAVQLILTLKVVGIAFEVHDTKLRSKGLAPFSSSSASFSPMNSFGNIAPNFMDIIHYSLCFMGLMTGPYYKYKTFDDMIHSNDLTSMPRWQLVFQRIKMLPVYLIAFLLMSMAFKNATLWDDAFYETSMVYRMLYVVALFVYFRTKFYIAWLCAESSCIAAGLGIYPAICNPKPGHGPTEPEKIPLTVEAGTEYSYETIYNIDEYAVEFVPTVRGALKAWNMTVQYWLAWHIYRRVPMKGPLRTVLVMLVSAYWHGLHGGYYLSLLTVPLMLMAEGWLGRDPSFWGKYLNWFLRMRAFEYMSVGFICLTGARTLRYWNSIYFSGHIAAVIILVAGTVYKNMTRNQRVRTSRATSDGIPTETFVKSAATSVANGGDKLHEE